ncbi:MAG: ribbon-helix-helix protein, CopG family, partial [bacterium]
RIIVNLPAKLYEDIKKIAKREYKSISGLIRESILERREEEFTKEEIALIEKGLKSFKKGKGINLKRGKACLGLR